MCLLFSSTSKIPCSHYTADCQVSHQHKRSRNDSWSKRKWVHCLVQCWFLRKLEQKYSKECSNDSKIAIRLRHYLHFLSKILGLKEANWGNVGNNGVGVCQPFAKSSRCHSTHAAGQRNLRKIWWNNSSQTNRALHRIWRQFGCARTSKSSQNTPKNKAHWKQISSLM